MAKIKSREISKIYKPHKTADISPVYQTYTITDNYTAQNGRVYNRYDENVVLAKEEVDANKK